MQRGFNLLEVAVASVIAGIIATAALSSFAVLNRQLVRLQAETTASDDAKTLVDFLVSALQGVGGGPVRPWMALHVENGADASFASRCSNFSQTVCGPADRVTYGLLVQGRNSVCPIVGISSITNIVSSEGSGTGCCLGKMALDGGYDSRPPPHASDPLLADLKIHTVAVSPDGLNRQISLDNIDTTACTARFRSGPLAGADNAPGLVTQFVDGTLSAVRIHTLYLNETLHELRSFEEKRGFNGVDVSVAADEVKSIASNIYDFQVQLGYDADGATAGRIVDQSNNSDEWLFNAAGDGVFPADTLRMTGVGVIVGVNVKDPKYSTTAQLVGGPAKTGAGLHLRAAMGRAALRNIFVFF